MAGWLSFHELPPAASSADNAATCAIT